MKTPTLEYAAPHTPELRRSKGTLQYTAAGLGLLFFYLLWGEVVMQLMEMVVQKVMPLQLNAMGASNKVIGFLVVSLPFIFNMSINPFVSFRSDNYRSAWGRRRPFLIVMTPLVTLALVLLAYSAEIGSFVHVRLLPGLGEKTVLIGSIAVLLSMYQIFHYLMSPMYYYLFVDVVPDAYLGRFLSLFRIVAAIKVYLFMTFIYGHALTHTRAIYIGCAVLYCGGFLWMCFMVKEGEYPPPAHKKRLGLWRSIGIFCRECYSHRHYVLFNLRNATWVLSGAVGVYGVFMAKDDLGLSLPFIGKIAGWTSLISIVLYYPIGMLCDRYGSARVLVISTAIHAPLALLSLLYMRDATSYVVLTMVSLPINAMIGTSEMTFTALMLPRERYGQFGAANQVVIGFVQIVGGVGAGWYMDYVTDCGKVVTNFRYLYLWSFLVQLLSLAMMVMLYRSWRRHGGPDNYVPPALD